jgi:presenilin 1
MPTVELFKRRTSIAPSNSLSTLLLNQQGDFIFYSVLVSKAALYSFTSFAACMLVILTGLGGTLILLAVHGKALPGEYSSFVLALVLFFFEWIAHTLLFIALPISIFLGVIVFFLTRYFMEPWIQEVLRLPFYV